jgi:hypothetical protein
MNTKLRLIVAAILYFASVCLVWAQDLGPQFKKFKEGIYVYVGLDPGRAETLSKQSPEIAAIVKDYKFIPPQIEYKDRMTLNVGERTFELYYPKCEAHLDC